jgi:hypothetical protein
VYAQQTHFTFSLTFLSLAEEICFPFYLYEHYGTTSLVTDVKQMSTDVPECISAANSQKQTYLTMFIIIVR